MFGGAPSGTRWRGQVIVKSRAPGFVSVYTGRPESSRSSACVTGIRLRVDLDAPPVVLRSRRRVASSCRPASLPSPLWGHGREQGRQSPGTTSAALERRRRAARSPPRSRRPRRAHATSSPRRAARRVRRHAQDVDPSGCQGSAGASRSSGSLLRLMRPPPPGACGQALRGPRAASPRRCRPRSERLGDRGVVEAEVEAQEERVALPARQLPNSVAHGLVDLGGRRAAELVFCGTVRRASRAPH